MRTVSEVESREVSIQPLAPSDSPSPKKIRFDEFLVYRSTGKPSEATLKAYRQDFTAIADLLAPHTGVPADDLACNVVDKDRIRTAFAAYADTHSPASIRRCWSTWNALCSYLFTSDLIVANPMDAVLRLEVVAQIRHYVARLDLHQDIGGPGLGDEEVLDLHRLSGLVEAGDAPPRASLRHEDALRDMTFSGTCGWRVCDRRHARGVIGHVGCGLLVGSGDLSRSTSDRPDHPT